MSLKLGSERFHRRHAPRSEHKIMAVARQLPREIGADPLDAPVTRASGRVVLGIAGPPLLMTRKSGNWRIVRKRRAALHCRLANIQHSD